MQFLKRVFVLFGLMAGVVMGGELKVEEDCTGLAAKFMGLVDVGEFDKAFAQVKPHWPIADARFQEVLDQTKGQLPKVAAAYGGRVEPGIERVRLARVGKSYLKVVYLQRFEKSAARWEIIFYRGEKGWYVNRVVWNDKTYELFREDE